MWWAGLVAGSRASLADALHVTCRMKFDALIGGALQLPGHCCRSGRLSLPLNFLLTVNFGLLNWTNFEVSFNWPAAFGAKGCGIREVKTTIRTTFCDRCAPDLNFALDSGCIFYWSATFGAKGCGIREVKTTIRTNFFCHYRSPSPWIFLVSDWIALFSRGTSQ
jgi:hypothetical protein